MPPSFVGLLSSPPHAEGNANDSEVITDELPTSKAGGPQSDNDTQEPGETHRSDDEETDGHKTGGDNDHTEGEGTKDNDKQREPPGQTEIGSGSAQSEHTVNRDPGPDDRNPLSENDTEGPEGDHPGNDDGTDNRITGDDTDQTTVGPRRESGDAEKGLHSARQTSKPKVGDN
ncbi:hypothetical protein FS837_004195 [Tulasnella sp. UAMH 9824]|nr:hypothetical protein FS837_004195 [Tulasnella sp. UAMH 9824]